MYEFVVLTDEQLRQSILSDLTPIPRDQRPSWKDRDAYREYRAILSRGRESIYNTIREKFIESHGITARIRTEMRSEYGVSVWTPEQRKTKYYHFPVLGLTHIWNSKNSLQGKNSWLNKIGVRIQYHGYSNMFSKEGRVVSHVVRTDKDFLAPLHYQFLRFIHDLQTDLEVLFFGGVIFPPTENYQWWLDTWQKE
jgi:hypothetical protein